MIYNKNNQFEIYIYKEYIRDNTAIKIFIIPETEFVKTVADFIIWIKTEIERYILNNDQKISIALSGGSTPLPIYKFIANYAISNPNILNGVWIQVDERDLEPSNNNSNQKNIFENLFALVIDDLKRMSHECIWLPIPTSIKNMQNFINMYNKFSVKDFDFNQLRFILYKILNIYDCGNVDDFDIERVKSITKNEICLLYEELIKFYTNKKSIPSDLAILGIGEDGHTASIFPDIPLQQHMSFKSWLTWYYRSKGYSRYTMTFNTLLKIPYLVFVVSGKNKNNISKFILQELEIYFNNKKNTFSNDDLHMKNFVPALELITRRNDNITYILFDDQATNS